MVRHPDGIAVGDDVTDASRMRGSHGARPEGRRRQTGATCVGWLRCHRNHTHGTLSSPITHYGARCARHHQCSRSTERRSRVDARTGTPRGVGQPPDQGGALARPRRAQAGAAERRHRGHRGRGRGARDRSAGMGRPAARHEATDDREIHRATLHAAASRLCAHSASDGSDSATPRRRWPRARHPSP